jgi:RNA polymerase sigma-70 factor (ECF subfamily)
MKSDQPPPIDPVWMREALERYERQLVRYAYRTVGDLETARDIVQDTFLRLIRVGRDSVEDHLAEWLFTVCRNRCFDVLRKESRMTNLSETTEATLTRQDPPAISSDGETEQHAKILALVEDLPPRQQEVIRLKFQNGLSYKEISRVTDLTVTNVGFLIHTGLKTVRERLSKQPIIGGAGASGTGVSPVTQS